MNGMPAQPEDFLASMAASSAERLAAARGRTSPAELERAAANRTAAPPLRLSADGFDLIAEIKRSSPSAGALADATLSSVAQARQYVAGGAAAISVLTEPSRFAGSLADLADVADAVGDRPVMRKDFLVDPYQVVEARAAGAGGVLLIAAMLEPELLRDMLQTTFDLGMFALVEAFDEADLMACIPVMAGMMPAIDAAGVCRMLLGINCRNLRTLEVEFLRLRKLSEQLPDPIPGVAESGVDCPDKAALVAGVGYRLALVGTALMRAADPVQAVGAMLSAGRAARRH